MLKLISIEYGHNLERSKLAELIEKEFNVICTEKDIEDYELLHITEEDWELENRKHLYGMQDTDLEIT